MRNPHNLYDADLQLANVLSQPVRLLLHSPIMLMQLRATDLTVLALNFHFLMLLSLQSGLHSTHTNN